MDRKNFIIKGITCLTLAGTFVSCNGMKSGGTSNKISKSNLESIPKFDDARSKKVIFVAHCILNQNARINKCAYTPSAIKPVVEELIKRDIGIIQMPCP